MNKILLAVTLAIFSTVSLAGADADKRMQRMINKLELSEEQAAQVATVMANQRAKRQDIRQQMEALREDTRDQMSGILTVEQLQQFDRMYQRKKEKRERLQARRDG